MVEIHINGSAIKYERLVWGELYEGTKVALIAAGVAESEWFPSVPVQMPSRPGKIERRFRFPREDGMTVVRMLPPYQRGIWSVSVYCSNEQKEGCREQSWAELAAARAEQERIQFQREEEEEKRKVAAAINILPPFRPGSMSESERHHMRVLRELRDTHREMIMDLALSLLANPYDAPAKQDNIAAEQRANGLKLVVDNTDDSRAR
jgi:hypothetical protein